MGNWRTSIIAIVAAGLGLAGGLLGQRGERQVAPVQDNRPVVEALASLEARVSALQQGNAALRNNVLASVAERAAAPTTLPSPSAPTEPQAADTELANSVLDIEPQVAQKSLEDGQALLQRITRRGEWSEPEHREWQHLVATAGREGSTALLVALSAAINEGKIRPDPR